MFAVFFLAGLILSGSLAYAGLVRGQLQFSKSTVWTGSKAKGAGIFALAVSVVLAAGVVWGVVMMLRG